MRHCRSHIRYGTAWVETSDLSDIGVLAPVTALTQVCYGAAAISNQLVHYHATPRVSNTSTPPLILRRIIHHERSRVRRIDRQIASEYSCESMILTDADRALL